MDAVEVERDAAIKRATAERHGNEAHRAERIMGRHDFGTTLAQSDQAAAGCSPPYFIGEMGCPRETVALRIWMCSNMRIANDSSANVSLGGEAVAAFVHSCDSRRWLSRSNITVLHQPPGWRSFCRHMFIVTTPDAAETNSDLRLGVLAYACSVTWREPLCI